MEGFSFTLWKLWAEVRNLLTTRNGPHSIFSSDLNITAADSGENEFLVRAVFSNELIFSKILEFLDFCDIKTCRNVCSVWNIAALPYYRALSLLSFQNIEKTCTSWKLSQTEEIFRKRQISKYLAKVTIPKIQNLAFWRFEDEFLKVDKVIQIVQLYENTLNYLIYTVSLHSSVQIELFQKLLPRLKNLKKLYLVLDIRPDEKVDFDFPNGRFIPLEQQPLTTVTTFKFYAGTLYLTGKELTDKKVQKVGVIAADIYRTFPAVQFLTLYNSYSASLFQTFFGALFYDTDFKRFKTSMSNQLGTRTVNRFEIERTWNLKKFKVIGSFILSDYNLFAQSKFITPLSSLSVEIHFHDDPAPVAKAYETLLWKHAPTLRSLTLHTLVSDGLQTIDICLPVMPKLQTLDVVDNEGDVSAYSAYQFRFKFLCQGQGESRGQGQPMSEEEKRNWTHKLVYSIQFPQLRNLSFRIFNFELEVEAPALRFEQMKRPLIKFVVHAESHRGQPVKCATLRHFDLFGVDDIELNEFGIDFVGAFPNVYNTAFNKIRKLIN